jgi:hypothetical protein
MFSRLINILNMENEKECCPKFNPEPWENKIFEWDNKKFIKAKVFTLFYMPINFGSVITKLMERFNKESAQIPDYLCLSEHTSLWNMNIYLATDRDISGLEHITLSGKYLSKVYEGDFSKTGEWCEDFNKYAKSHNLKIGKFYMWYTTCPKCAKKYGKNYVVIISEIIN